MLVTTGVLVGLFLVYIVFQQAGVILEARRYAKELKSHRELADTAEASRFTELRIFLDAELRKIEAQNAAATRELGARIERLEQQLQDRLPPPPHPAAATTTPPPPRSTPPAAGAFAMVRQRLSNPGAAVRRASEVNSHLDVRAIPQGEPR